MPNNNSSSNPFYATPYLDQASRYLLRGDSILARIVNTPYKIITSLFDAVICHYEEEAENSDVYSSFTDIFHIVGFVFSNYAVICFMTAVILNHLILTSTMRVRLGPSRFNLSPLRGKIMHVLAILSLDYLLVRILLAKNNGELVRYHLFDIYATVSWSYIIETFVALSMNRIPLEDSGCSIFELAINFYSISLTSEATLDQGEYLSGLVFIILTRLLIHTVELLNIRRRRLAGSIIMNLLYLCYLRFIIYTKGYESVPFATRFREFPDMLHFTIIIISLLSYGLACFVRIDPRGQHSRNRRELRFHSFMRDWRLHLNFTGEEDFSTIVAKLASLLTSETGNTDRGLHREFLSIRVPEGLSQSYEITPYMNKIGRDYLQVVPDIGYPEGTTTQVNHRNEGEDGLDGHKRGVLHRLATFFVRNKDKEQIYDELDNNLQSCESDMREMSISSRHGGENTGKSAESLLDTAQSPEDNYLSDKVSDVTYTPDSDSYVEDTELSEDDGEEEDDDALSLIDPAQDMNWFLSTKDILREHLREARTITRSKYAKLRDIPRKSTWDVDENFLCVVCKTNRRNIVLWPCKCLAICDNCRTSLALRKYDSCMCCRRKVDGYSCLNPCGQN